MAKFTFICSIVLIFYAYIGYPISLYIISRFVHSKRDAISSTDILPMVTIIITAYNEENKIENKLNNVINLDYIVDNRQIIVASDGSEDNTNEIVKKYEPYGVELLAIPKRSGKENAQKEAVKRAKGDIIVFTDVATMLDKWGLKQIVSNFSDPTIGCVSSEDKVIEKNGKIGGEGFYVKYEMWVRRLESDINSLVGLSGSFFAARKVVCEDFSGRMQSDFRTLLNSIRLGYRGICDPNAIGYYQDVAKENYEFNRKVRTIVRGLTVYFSNLEFLNVFRYGLFSYQYLCHKLLKWLVPIFLGAAFISNMFLINISFIYSVIFISQVVFYIIAIYGIKFRPTSHIKSVCKIPVYFTTVNASIVVAWWQFLSGKRVVMWTPSER